MSRTLSNLYCGSPVQTYRANPTCDRHTYVSKQTQLAANDFTRKKKSVGQKYNVPHNDEIAETIRRRKLAFWKWKYDGRPCFPRSSFMEMKAAKQILRQKQRRETVRRRHDQAEKIMASSKQDKQTFYQLIRKQRPNCTDNQVHLKHDGVVVTSPHEICNIWSKHFGALVESTDNSEAVQTMAAEIDITEEHLSNLVIPEDYLPTLGEVRAAVPNLSTNNSPDYMGLMAEHFIYGGELVIRLLGPRTY